jgi:hypothetical protein
LTTIFYLFTEKTMKTANEILTFCSIVTSFTALSLLNSSLAEALPANQISGNGSANVGASTFGANRNFSVGSQAGAVSPSSVKTNSNSTLINNPTTLQTGATSGSQAGSKLQGNGSTKSTLTGNSTGANSAQISADNVSTAKVTGAKTGAVSADSSSSLNSTTGVGSATGNYQYSGGR